MVREHIISALISALKSCGVGSPAPTLEHPADLSHGDYSSNAALQYAKELRIAPRTLAEKIVAALGVIEEIEKIEIAGAGFINFHISAQGLVASVQKAIDTDMWGAGNVLAGKKIMVEYTDPNPFKEFHIGHLMSNAIGESVSRLLQFSGAEVQRANYQGDVGPHVAKAIWAMKNKKVADADWGSAYVVGNKAYEEDESAKKEIDEINAKVYDRSDKEINGMYDAGRAASLAHFEALYTVLGTKFDHYFFESKTAPRGIEMVRAHSEVFVESDGAVVYRGEEEGLHTRVFITSKGLPTYETKDLGLARMKQEVWSADTYITVTANEQRDYFRVVLAAMRRVLPEMAGKIVHITHGMMRFADGKMSSRTGNVVTGESLLADITEVAKARASESRADDENKLAQEVSVAAIKYQILKQGSGKDIIFDRDRALSIEGDSGPYMQYAHARAQQIIGKADVKGKIDATAPTSELARLIHRFPEVVEYASRLYEPHILATYLTELAASFNSWYAQEQILDGTPAAAHKVALTDAVRRTLKNGLWILGIPAPERM